MSHRTQLMHPQPPRAGGEFNLTLAIVINEARRPVTGCEDQIAARFNRTYWLILGWGCSHHARSTATTWVIIYGWQATPDAGAASLGAGWHPRQLRVVRHVSAALPLASFRPAPGGSPPTLVSSSPPSYRAGPRPLNWALTPPARRAGSAASTEQRITALGKWHPRWPLPAGAVLLATC